MWLWQQSCFFLGRWRRWLRGGRPGSARTRLEAVLGDLEFAVTVHESPGHFTQEIGFGNVSAIRLFVKRFVALQVLRKLRRNLAHHPHARCLVERMQCNFWHGYLHQGTYGSRIMSLFTRTRRGQPWRMVMVGCTSNSRSMIFSPMRLACCATVSPITSWPLLPLLLLGLRARLPA